MISHFRRLPYIDLLVKSYPALASISETILQVIKVIGEAYEAGSKLLICGNGGSATDSEHIACELMKAFVLPRTLKEDDINKLQNIGISDWEEIAVNLQRGLPAIALTAHSALISAIANDISQSMVYAQQVYVLGKPGDVLLCISTSGNSENVIMAAKVAQSFGLKTIGLTGSRSSILESYCDITIKVPCTETYQVQEYHLPVYHTICLMLESYFFS